MHDKVEKIFKGLFPSYQINSNFSRDTCDEWDSINHLNLVFELENEFEVNIEPDEMINIISIETAMELLNSKLNK
jgi:acyl carrier protein